MWAVRCLICREVRNAAELDRCPNCGHVSWVRASAAEAGKSPSGEPRGDRSDRRLDDRG
jgi:hypothetical protein